MPRAVQETRGECLFLDLSRCFVFQGSDANGHAKGRVKGHAKGRAEGRSSLNIDAWPHFERRKPIPLSKAFTLCTVESRALASVNYWAFQTDVERTSKANWEFLYLCFASQVAIREVGRFANE